MNVGLWQVLARVQAARDFSSPGPWVRLSSLTKLVGRQARKPDLRRGEA